MFNCQKLSKTLINDAMVRKFIRDVVRISHNCSKNLWGKKYVKNLIAYYEKVENWHVRWYKTRRRWREVKKKITVKNIVNNISNATVFYFVFLRFLTLCFSTTMYFDKVKEERNKHHGQPVDRFGKCYLKVSF